MNLIDLITAADEGYPDGVIMQWYLEIKARENSNQRRPDSDIGDTLAKFIVLELIETFDPEASDQEQFEEAARVMYSAKNELMGVIASLEKLHG